MPKHSVYTGYNSKLVRTARSLRKQMTTQENHLWYDFLRSYKPKFYRQRPVAGYITDFYCSAAGLIIELDGSQHYTEDGLEYDKIRTDVLERFSLRVLRFTNMQIDREFEAVCSAIDAAVNGMY